MSTIERRFSPSPVGIGGGLQNGVEQGGRTVRGYAALFSVPSANLGTATDPIIEYIEPGAFDGVLKDDVRALFNHDSNLILARSNRGRGTMRLWVDKTGLGFEFTAPETQLGNDLLVSLRRGDITGCSFAFTIAPNGDKITTEGRKRIRRITKVGSLLDVGPVSYPAYPATTVGARGSSPSDTVGTSNFPQRDYWAARFGILTTP